MRLCISVILLVLAIIAGLGYRQYLHIITPGTLPEFDLTTYWGRGDVDKNKDNNWTVTNTVRFGWDATDDLKRILSSNLSLPPPLEGVNFEYGVNTEWLSEFIKYWREDYLEENWIVRQLEMNRAPHYTTYIQGYMILNQRCFFF